MVNILTRQRDESKEDKPAVLYYKKLPPNIPDCFVMLVTYYILSLLTGTVCHPVPGEILTNTVPGDDICRYTPSRESINKYHP